jgi:hypothetical protein
VKKEVLTAFSHAVHGDACKPYIPYFVSHGILQRFCGAFAIFDKFVLRDCLRGLDDVLKVGAMRARESLKNNEGGEDGKTDSNKIGIQNEYALMVVQMGGVSKLIRLQQHQDDEVYKLSLGILETYFSNVLETDDRIIYGNNNNNMSMIVNEQLQGEEKIIENISQNVSLSLCGQPPRKYRFRVGQRVECLVMESEQGGVWEKGIIDELDYHHMCGHCRMLHQSAYLIKLDSGGTCKSSIDEDSMIRLL